MQEKKIDYTLKGERSAMGGYLPQYDEFAIGVYDAMIAGELEEIRVADMESNVGKLDDAVYVTTNDVIAYQIKWSIAEDTMSYPDFKGLIPEIVDGWRKLKKLYSDKIVHPRLLTNKNLTNGDSSIKSLTGKDSGGFVAYEQEVLQKLKAGVPIAANWAKAVDELKGISTLADDEWLPFWTTFAFIFAYKQENIGIADASTKQRVRDILDIHRLIQEMAGRPGFQICMTTREIMVRLNWTNRLETTFDHNLIISEESYVPNVAGIALLNACLKGKSKGYIFLKGTPGSGKSTLLTQWTRGLENPSVRFYAFDFLNPSSQRNNDSSRGDSLTFLNDIVLLIRKAGINPQKTVLPVKDFSTLKNRFYEQLDTIAQQYKETGIPFIIVVDGLDHITREYSGCVHKMMEVLPSTTEIPEGVIFVLGSQYYDHLGLNVEIERESKNKQHLIEMPPLSKDETVELCCKLLDKSYVNTDTLEKCWLKSQGHPLYLRYLLNHIIVKSVEVLDEMDDTPEGVEDYYARITGPLLEKTTLKNALGLLARITGIIRLDDVRALCSEDSLSDIKNKMWHLLKYDKGGQEIAFFHNSFRQYLLNKTAEDVLTENYSKNRDIAYYKTLSDHFVSRWEHGYYLYKAEEYDQFITEITPENLFAQAQDYRPVWSIRRDLEKGVDIARQRKDPYLLVRYVLLENQLSLMDKQDYNVLSLIEDFIQTGRGVLAKAIIREGRLLHCSQEYALDLAVEFLKTGDLEEANLLFEMSYPDFLSHNPKEYYHNFQDLRDKESLLNHWVQTAAYFLDWTSIKIKVSNFISYLQSLSAQNNEQFNAEKCKQDFVSVYLDSLIDQERWKEFEEAIDRLSTDKKYYPLIFHAYDKAIDHLSKTAPQSDLICQYFIETEKFFKMLEMGSVGCFRMAYLALKSGQANSVIETYMKNVVWADLGSFYQDDIRQSFHTLSPFIFYVKTRAQLGYSDEMITLVPDDSSHADNAVMVNYARRVFKIAQMTGMAMSGVKDVSFLSHVNYCIRNYDSLLNPVPHNKFSYTLSQQRADFYEYAIDSAQVFGEEILGKLAETFERYFSESTCRADAEAQRKAILAFYRKGYDKEWCKKQLHKVDVTMMTNMDIDGRERESLHQGRAWLEVGCNERAEELFHQTIKESFGVGYRKDYQPSLFAEWIGKAIKNEPEHAIEHIHWLTSRLKHIETIAESSTRLRATERLLHETFAFNLKSGLKLAIWLLDNEYDYFQSVASTLLKALTKVAQTEAEYQAIFRFYTEIYLYIDDNDTSDLDTSLQKAVVDCGQRILGERFTSYIPLLKAKIETECPESISNKLIKGLDDILSAPAEENETVALRSFDPKIAKAEKYLIAGKKREAWKMVMTALEDSRPTGWVRYYDGGTRINACEMLQKIDEKEGREFTLELFARDILDGDSYGTIQYLDEIVPLLTENIDPKRLFDEEFAYMNRMLREDTCHEDDKPNIEPDDSTVCEILRDWLLWLADMPIICVMERAKILLTHLYNESDIKLIGILPESFHSERLLLEVGCYLAELQSTRLVEFREIAKKDTISDNYQYRIYAAKILKALGEEIPSAPYKVLPVTYSILFTDAIPKPLSWLPTQKDNVEDINWSDADSVMGVASHWCGYLSHCSGIERRTLNCRAVELMKKYGDVTTSNANKNIAINRHYDTINLRCSYKKAHVQAALDGMLEVAAELKDGGAVHGHYLDNLFMTRDFGNINIKAVHKPAFIQRIAAPQAWSVDKNWIDGYEDSPRLAEDLPEYDGWTVIGECTHIKKMAENFPMEEYQAKLSFNDTEVEPFVNSIFSDSPFMCDTSAYLSIGSDDPEIILLRGGYYTDFPNQSKWIAFNPALASFLGWRPCPNNRFAWLNDSSEKMVESVFWRSGNINEFSRDRYEVSEGWMVIASKKAIEDLREVAILYSHKMIMRRMENNLLDTSHRTYRITHYKQAE